MEKGKDHEERTVRPAPAHGYQAEIAQRADGHRRQIEQHDKAARDFCPQREECGNGFQRPDRLVALDEVFRRLEKLRALLP